ncbi:MAG: GTPase [Sulfolobales archaeon]
MEKRPRCPDETLKKLPTYKEVREHVLRVSEEPLALPRSVSKKALVKYYTKIDKIREYLVKNVLNPLSALRDVLEVSFYEKIAANTLPEGVSAKEVTNKLIGKIRIINKLSREYRSKIAVSFDSAEARELYREYVGRVLSIVRRLSKLIEMTNNAIFELKRTPCIDPSVPVVAVAGLPQVGKSTLVSVLSTAKPKSSPFPFTTKEIIMGHVNMGFRRLQILDLPGILDRPPNDMNEIERKALIAITEVADLVLFIVDPSEDFYYGLESQLGLLRSLKDWVNTDILVAINKVDKVSMDRVERVSRAIADVLPNTKIVTISALKREGLSELMNAMIELLNKISK